MGYDADRLGFLRRMAREYGGLVRLDDRAWLVNDPAAAMTVLRSTGREFAGTRDFLHRRTSAPEVDPMVQRINGEIVRLLAAWASGPRLPQLKARVEAAVSALDDGLFDPLEFARRMSLAVVGEICCGPDAESAWGPSRELLDALLARMNSPWVLPPWLPTPRNLRITRADRRLDRALRALAAAPEACGEGTLVHDLGVGGDRIPEPFDPASIAMWVTSLLLPAQEPPAGGLGWSVYRLAREHAWRERAVAEARGTDPADDTDPVRRYPVISAMVHEALRLNPPTWLLVRRVAEPVDILGYRATPGQLVYVSPWILHRDPRSYPDPERFDPERWIDPSARRTALKSYLAYGAGPNRCPGYALNLSFTTLVLATLLRERDLVGERIETVTADTRRAMLPSGLRVGWVTRGGPGARPPAHDPEET